MLSHFCVLCCFLISYEGCLVDWENTGSIPDFVSCKAFSMHRIAEGLKSLDLTFQSHILAMRFRAVSQAQLSDYLSECIILAVL